ncbi:MAG: IS66 family insertion sequence element accessory protein TnpB [Myxococcota bacterium]
MIGWPRSIRVWAYPEPVDLRRGFNGLIALVENELGKDAVGGDLYLFVNRKRTIAKVLMHDGTGIAIYMKRLTAGRFAALWLRHRAGAIKLTSNELALFLEGSPYAGRAPLSPPTISARGAVDSRSRV